MRPKFTVAFDRAGRDIRRPNAPMPTWGDDGRGENANASKTPAVDGLNTSDHPKRMARDPFHPTEKGGVYLRGRSNLDIRGEMSGEKVTHIAFDRI